MFGLTKREQRWKAEQQAAELFVGFAAATVRAAADVRIAEANAELERLRKENAELRAAARVKPGEDARQTLVDCANALDETLPADHPYRKIAMQARTVADGDGAHGGGDA